MHRCLGPFRIQHHQQSNSSVCIQACLITVLCSVFVADTSHCLRLQCHTHRLLNALCPWLFPRWECSGRAPSSVSVLSPLERRTYIHLRFASSRLMRSKHQLVSEFLATCLICISWGDGPGRIIWLTLRSGTNPAALSQILTNLRR